MFRRKKKDSGKPAQAKVEIVKVPYGFLGYPHKKNLQRAIEKWLAKGYELKHQEEVAATFVTRPQTVLTFIKPAESGS